MGGSIHHAGPLISQWLRSRCLGTESAPWNEAGTTASGDTAGVEAEWHLAANHTSCGRNVRGSGTARLWAWRRRTTTGRRRGGGASGRRSTPHMRESGVNLARVTAGAAVMGNYGQEARRRWIRPPLCPHAHGTTSAVAISDFDGYGGAAAAASTTRHRQCSEQAPKKI
uniref:Uncharacterized protein n=1 Tax=Oryza rufipogon TaxID=4529 RepID=A0A0E0QFP7_ORYRU